MGVSFFSLLWLSPFQDCPESLRGNTKLSTKNGNGSGGVQELFLRRILEEEKQETGMDNPLASDRQVSTVDCSYSGSYAAAADADDDGDGDDGDGDGGGDDGGGDDNEKKVSGVDWLPCVGEEGVAGDWGQGKYTNQRGIDIFQQSQQ